MLEAIVYYLVLLDSVWTSVAAWSGYGDKLNKQYGFLARYFPITRGWASYYLVLVLWIGWALWRLGVLPY